LHWPATQREFATPQSESVAQDRGKQHPPASQTSSASQLVAVHAVTHSQPHWVMPSQVGWAPQTGYRGSTHISWPEQSLCEKQPCSWTTATVEGGAEGGDSVICEQAGASSRSQTSSFMSLSPP
jgi:hypothetical protein